MEELSGGRCHGGRNHDGMYQSLAGLSFILGAAILLFMASLLLISSLLFIAGCPISQYNFWLSVLAASIAAWRLCGHYYGNRAPLAFPGVMLCLAVIFLSGICLEGKIYDLSWDGQTYHQEGVIQLANGWNPLRDAPLSVVNSQWINHYPKGPWMACAALDLVTGQIEQAKVFNLLLILSSFFLCLSTLLAFYRKQLWGPLLFSLLAACNPVSIMQATTFYIDGQVASMLVIVLALLFSIALRPEFFPALTLTMGVIIAVNIKFTAPAYLLALILPVALYLFLTRRLQAARTITLALALGFLAGLLLVGFNPYVTNTVRNGNPCYPLAGRNALDITTANSPANFSGMNRFAKLAASLLSRTDDAATPRSSHLKWPFTLTAAELNAINFDTRTGGFGPLFGGALLLSLALIAFSWPVDPKKTLFYGGLAMLLLCSAVINPEAWWARYAPQVWLLPVICAMLGLALNNRWARVTALAIILTLVLNLALVGGSYFQWQYEGNLALKSQLAEMKRAHLNLVKFQLKYSNRQRFVELGIPYQEVATLNGPDVKSMAYSDTLYRTI